jgi:molybdenum cofactor sulfurtransferase
MGEIAMTYDIAPITEAEGITLAGPYASPFAAAGDGNGNSTYSDGGSFRRHHPAFAATSILDELRATEYARLDALGQIYLDYTGGGLYAASQIHDHLRLLSGRVFGNPHSINPTSQAMTELDEQARAFVLSFFNASPDEYTVIFTPNASGALRLVGESYPFAPDGHLLLSVDNHNSVNGIREFARAKGAPISYAPLESAELRTDETALLSLLTTAKRKGHSFFRTSRGTGHSLFAYPAQSNFTGVQHPLTWIKEAQDNGWDVLLDAASFVPCNRLDLSRWHPDFVPISFYKMFGYPTGVGCLLARKKTLAKLQRPWFAGGTINTASVQGDWHVMAEGEAAFEDGTINYLSLPAVEIGLRHLASIGMETIHTRIMCLTGYLLETLQLMRHRNGAPLVQIYGPRTTARRGGTIALNILTPEGRIVDERLIDRRAAHARISLRTGCFCNPGAAEAAFGITKQLLRERVNKPATNLDEYIAALGMQSAGAIRVSLGLVSNLADVHHLVQFVQSFQDTSPGRQDLPPRRQC